MENVGVQSKRGVVLSWSGFPTRGAGIFGTLMDAWQRPIDDVGAAGRDRGQGATYLLLPHGYNGPLLPKALVYEQRT